MNRTDAAQQILVYLIGSVEQFRPVLCPAGYVVSGMNQDDVIIFRKIIGLDDACVKFGKQSCVS